MKVLLDLSEGNKPPVEAEVLAILYDEGKRLFAVKAMVHGAPWYGLIHEDSTAFVQIE